jgi:tRNA-intron endonuclease
MSEEVRGQLQGDKVKLGPEAVDLYEQAYFGRPSASGLDLSLVEAAYLVDRSRISVISAGSEIDFKSFFQAASSRERGFEFRYVVYKDLRERGYYVQPGRPDFRVYPRGGHPGKTPAEFYVQVVSERNPMPLKEIVEAAGLAAQMRKRLMLAIVDEESDITFYEARKKDLSGRMREERGGGRAILLEDRVVLWDPAASQLLHQNGFYGKPIGASLQLSLVESAYLLEKGRISLSDRIGAQVELEGLKARARQIEEGFDLKYQVYKDLRERRLVVKTGFKFGTHFRAYKKVEIPDKVPHSEYLVHALPLDHVFSPPALSRAVRLANSVRKEMVFAYPEKAVSYLEISRLKP